MLLRRISKQIHNDHTISSSTFLQICLSLSFLFYTLYSKYACLQFWCRFLNAFSKSFQFRVPDKANFLPFDKESSEGIELSLLDDETILWPFILESFLKNITLKIEDTPIIHFFLPFFYMFWRLFLEVLTRLKHAQKQYSLLGKKQ